MLYPDWRILTVSSIPVYRSCLSTNASLKRRGSCERKWNRKKQLYLISLFSTLPNSQSRRKAVPFLHLNGYILQSKVLTGPASPSVCSAMPAQWEIVNINSEVQKLLFLYRISLELHQKYGNILLLSIFIPETVHWCWGVSSSCVGGGVIWWCDREVSSCSSTSGI